MTCKNLLPLLFADDTSVCLIVSANVEFSTNVEWLKQKKLTECYKNVFFGNQNRSYPENLKSSNQRIRMPPVVDSLQSLWMNV